MEYKASMDRTTGIITGLIILLIARIAYLEGRHILNANGNLAEIWPRVLTIIFVFIIIILCYLWAPRGYALDGSMLIIRRLIGDVKIKFDDFQAVKRIENAGPLSGIRIFGVGGLFGYFGQFYLWGYGPVTGYATRLTGRLLIVTRQGKQIIITPDDRGFMDDLKKKLALQTYSLN